jgi:hypothetical protein
MIIDVGAATRAIGGDDGTILRHAEQRIRANGGDRRDGVVCRDERTAPLLPRQRRLRRRLPPLLGTRACKSVCRHVPTRWWRRRPIRTGGEHGHCSGERQLASAGHGETTRSSSASTYVEARHGPLQGESARRRCGGSNAAVTANKKAERAPLGALLSRVRDWLRSAHGRSSSGAARRVSWPLRVHYNSSSGEPVNTRCSKSEVRARSTRAIQRSPTSCCLLTVPTNRSHSLLRKFHA